jgi:hypothetical protein
VEVTRALCRSCSWARQTLHSKRRTPLLSSLHPPAYPIVAHPCWHRTLASSRPQAFFTEPDDQSAWWYHRFLVTWAGEALAHGAQSDQYRALLHAEVRAAHHARVKRAIAALSLRCQSGVPHAKLKVPLSVVAAM